MITHSKNHLGVVYPYFICAGRHSKRVATCTQKAVLIEEVERKVESIYDSYALPQETLEEVKEKARSIVASEREKYSQMDKALARERMKLERRSKTLLEAHLEGAVPLKLLKEEQESIGARLAAIEYEENLHRTSFDEITGNIDRTLEILEDCGTAYRMADNHIKRMMNQVVFEKIYIGSNETLAPMLNEPFKTVVESVKEQKRSANESVQESHAVQHAIGSNMDTMQESRGSNPLATFLNSSYTATEQPKTLFSGLSSAKMVISAGVEPACG